jgi:solute:Na+ symporter, SSS family
MACRSDKDAKLAAVVFTVAQVFVRSLLWLPIGLGLLVLFPPQADVQNLVAAREFTYVRGIAELLPAGVMGLMLAGMLAALASTLDTHLNWGASYWTNDIFRRFVFQSWLKREPSQRTLVWVARASSLLTFLIALAILPALSSIQLAWQISLLLGAGMGVLLVLRWVWWRINAWGELVCILVSLLLAPVLILAFPEEDALRLLLMAAGATSAGVLASLLTGVDRERLKDFYMRAQPPGFWGPIARQVDGAAGLAQGRFFRGIAATLLAAFSIFCLLTGFGSWLVGSPAPLFFPWRTAWITLLILVGGGLIPVWIRFGFQDFETGAKGQE